MNVKIYGLVDEREPSVIRYVGKTKMSLRKRLQSHIDEARNSKAHTHKLHWIRKILSENAKPSITILEICEEFIWQDKEKEWINKLTDLTNSTEGGEVIGYKTSSILKYSKFGKFIKEYESIIDACIDTDLERGVINSALQRNPEGGFGGNFIWRYSLLGKKNFLPPYISNQNTIFRIIDIEEEKSFLFESLKEGLKYFNLKRCGNINRCINEKIPYKNRYFIMKIN